MAALFLSLGAPGVSWAQAPQPDPPQVKPAPAAAPKPATPPAAPTPPSDLPPETAVEGFRSARFGMTEAQVRAAIKADFKVADAAIKAATHAVEQTRSLQVTVRDLVAVGIEAQVAYVFGFRSKNLTQVNVLWSAADTAGAETVQAIAGALRDLFISQGQSGRFTKESIVINTRAADGSIVVFRGADDKKRLVQALFIAAQTAPAAPGGARQIGAQLRLMYIESPDNLDVQRPKSGQF
ncbi:MAG TPA: hypothetical protein VJ890_00895 [Vineibacter sp.]|nr:hypothetical protein [Vineibacter sp.]